MAGISGSGPRWRGLLQDVHLWVGLILFVPLVVIGITGSVLVFHHELIDLQNPPPPMTLAAGEARSASEILAAAQAAARANGDPEVVARFYRAPESPGGRAEVLFAKPGARLRGGAASWVHVDPVSLETARMAQSGSPLVSFVHVLHANLMIDGRLGRQVVGWFGLAMLVLGLSGLVLWWPRGGRWRAAFLIKRGASGFRLHRDLHSAVGIWTLLLFIVVSFSGVYLAFPQTTGDVLRVFFEADPPRGFGDTAPVEPRPGVEPLGLEGIVALAESAAPGSRVTSIRFGNGPEDAIRVGLERPGSGHGAPSISATVDPWAAEVVELRDPRDFTTGETLMVWQRPLHAGEGLGWTWKLLVFVSGLLPLLFAITGFYMWWIKRRARKSVGRRVRQAQGAPAE